MALTNKRRAVSILAIGATSALVLAGCAGGNGEGDEGNGGGGNEIVIGTTDKIVSLDPAGSYDNGSFSVQQQVFPMLMGTPFGSSDVEPDLAESAEFTAPTEYTVTLPEGLKWANGNELTSSDVAFSFDRQLSIAHPNGPSSLLGNLESVEATDDLTVVFTLKSENDQTFPQVLSSPVGPIVDEEVFSADELTTPDTIVDANAFGGQYVITNYSENDLVAYEANPEYQGLLPAAKTETVLVSYYTDASNLKLDIQEGNIDVAYRSLSATDIDDLRGQDNVNVVEGPGGEIRYLVFNFDTMPFGAGTGEADEEKALAVRQAAAHLLDRAEIASQVYQDTYTPLYSFVPDGLTGATQPLMDLYGDGEGGPDADAAAAVLEEAGITEPVTLNIQYSNDHYGPSSGDEYALIKDQLESTGLFTVELSTTEWGQYSQDRREDVYPVYQLGWFPDYSDADNYLTPFFSENNFLINHYSNTEVQDLIAQQVSTEDPDERSALLGQIQEIVAGDLSTLPYLQGQQVAVTGTNVTGAEDTLDASFKFRYAALGIDE
ncbi:ABC transporter substrate-binding protein [Agrococcus casei]|uniref:Oligopeptide ABC transporter, periplasmic oligopeptide-binding protein OppA (TC 3.A.1.5.1) n=8 Tax=Agrococcus TaxID=46352 RepID=A0A1R4GMZ6_9MICO|nr:ABC transporter substrate-binding protein [Agrococcus casei]SJM69494.1 Oligopeptide ABC transporter, periplasmic oligopeptide-binding protein OppA (TC 3.A.1.5.1) [Agrococcus casei LMG 22410]